MTTNDGGPASHTLRALLASAATASYVRRMMLEYGRGLLRAREGGR